MNKWELKFTPEQALKRIETLQEALKVETGNSKCARMTREIIKPELDFLTTYLAEYNKLPSKEKPTAKLVGENGNIFNLIGICARVLKKNGQDPKEMIGKATSCRSYDEALMVLAEYVEIE
jgi:hypothetical protein